jgi:alpha-L-rhamnosidase
MRIQRFVFLPVAFIFLVANCGFLKAQVDADSPDKLYRPINPELLSKSWPAQWITCPGAGERDPVVFHLRKVMELREVPQHFLVHVSADNQFLLYVNQKRVGSGPARGDLAHWRFETYDLGPFLHAGKNILSATVWNFGTHSAVAQISDRAGFLLQGDGPSERIADSNNTWEVEEDKSRRPLEPTELSHFYYAAEPGEGMDAALFDWSWDEEPEMNSQSNAGTRWKKAFAIDRGIPRGAQMQSNWQLVPDLLPAMEWAPIPSGKMVRASGVEGAEGFPEEGFQVPAHSTASVLIDAWHLVTAYPELTVSGGKGASVRITYAEALVDEKGVKGNRNQIEGKHIFGLVDQFLPSGSSKAQSFIPLAWRTWRYLQLAIITEDQPLRVEGLRTWFTAFPFKERAHFESDDTSLESIWNIGWRTARLDAHDTYMDTPYWERLQYIGDTRIQALISYTVSGDDRLARQAIQSFNDSRIPDGITQSRYPSALSQFIPTFSLLWVGMVHDFWMYRGDGDFVRAQLPGTRTVLDWFMTHQRPDGLMGKLPWWAFVDWAADFQDGVPPQDENGGSTAITLQYVEALRYAAEMETSFGDARRAAMYREAVARAVQAIRNFCWNRDYGLIADTPAQTHYSQHANILAAWLDVIPPEQQKALLTKVLAASETGVKVDQPLPPISRASYYFRFYLARAVQHAGMGGQYLQLLQPWRDMEALGLTTWAEQPEPTRSDSHAWSAHPNFDLLTIVAGVRPKTPGFKAVMIEPNLGVLKHVASAMPSPQGEIRVEYTREENDGVKAQIALPGGTTGDLVWSGETYRLHEGNQQMLLPRN